VAISPDDILVLGGMRDGSICMWEISTGRLLGRVQSHSFSVFSVAFTPDGHGFLSGSGDKTINYWEIDFDALRKINDKGILNGDMEGEKGCLKRIPGLTGHKGGVLDVSISPDGQWVASASWDETVMFWDTSLAPRLMLKGHKNLGMFKFPCLL
jgi:glucose repression regulatory protein TUP1